MANSNIPVKIEFGGVDNITPVLGSINLKLTGIGKSFETINSISKKISLSTSLTSLMLFTDKLHNFSSHITSGFRDNIEAYSTIEDNTNRIRSLFEGNADWKFFRDLNNHLLSASQITRHTKDELSDLTFLIARSGDIYKNPTNFFDAFNQTLLLTDAGKGEFNADTAFKFLNSQSNIFQARKNNIRLSDQVNQTLLAKDLAGMDLVDMDYFQQQFGALLGISTNANLASFLALEGLLTKHDLKGEKGGTAMRNIIQSLVPAIDSRMISEEAKQKFENSGIALDFSNKGRNAILSKLGITKDSAFTKEGKLKITVLDDFVNALEKINPKERLSYIRQIFGKQGLSAGLTISNYLDEYKKLRDEINNPSLFNSFGENQANSSRNTLGAKIDEAKNSWNNFKLSILDNSTGNALSNLVDGFKNIATSAQSMNGDLKSVIGLFGVSGYALFSISDKLMPLFITIKLLPDVFKSLAKLSSTLYAALLPILTNPVFLALAGIGALGYIIYSVYDEGNKEINEKKIKKQQEIEENQFNALYTPKEKESLFTSNLREASYSNRKIIPTKDNLVDSLKQIKLENNNKNITNILNSYSDSRNAKSIIDINVNGLPQGSTVIQKTKNMPPANLKLGLLGGSLQ